MQAPSYFIPSLTIPKTSSTKFLHHSSVLNKTLLVRNITSTKTMAVASEDPTVDYTSPMSVFPAEACDTIGGEACNAEIYPEAKPEPNLKSSKKNTTQESVDREYLDYTEAKTVFPGEACDDLGGEFCQPDYQKGVY